MPQKIMAELRRKWWLWGCLAFTVLLLGSLFVFRSSLYDSAQHGLPFLAGTSYHLLQLLSSSCLMTGTSALSCVIRAQELARPGISLHLLISAAV